MTRLPLVILRPEPGASETEARAQALGLTTIKLPLFKVAAEAWEAPPASTFDALLLTSANAARLGGAGLAAYAGLPCLAVGEATAAAARKAGIDPVWVGPDNGASALSEAAARGWTSLLWLCGVQHSPLAHPGITLSIMPVYSAHAVESANAARTAAFAHPAIILLHSQRAGWALADMAIDRQRFGLIAISAGVAAVAGEGWAWVHWPELPRDQDMLELAATLCQKAPL